MKLEQYELQPNSWR